MAGRDRGRKGGSGTTQLRPGRSGKPGSSAAAGRATRGRDPVQQHSGLAAHAPELVALAALGLAVFLLFVLVAPDRGGLLGDAAHGALQVLLGRLAFLVPLGLVTVAGLLVLEVRPAWTSAWVLGLGSVLLALLLLLAAGFPPFGAEHPATGFVSEVYRSRGGWIGELLFVTGRRLVGGVGVALVGWLALLAGLSLVSGLTFRRVAAGTGRAAQAAKAGVEERSRRRREYDDDVDQSLDDPFLHTGGTERRVPAFPPTEADDEDGWAATTVMAGPAGPRLLDGQEAFPDLFTTAEAETGQVSGTGEGDRAETLPLAGPVSPADAGAAEAEGPSPGEAGPAPGDGHRGALVLEEGLSSLPTYILPDAEILKRSAPDQGEVRGDRDTANLLIETLAHFGVDARMVGMVVGPRVTRFELQLAPGTKVSKVAGLKDDLAYALASTEIRILAPIPGKQAVGVEVPNRRPHFVTLGDIYRDFPAAAGPLMVWLGKDISGKAVYTDLSKLPHLLIAGTTGSGKSGCVNCIISSILLRATPDEVRMILIDPKKVELSPYERIPHLLVPVVTNMKNAAGVLANVVKEMEGRYELMELEHARHLDEMNKKRARRGEAKLPYVVVVVDELADLMMVSPTEVEDYIIRIAQKARAVGIHLVVATQRPSVDVITGMIKANIPSRIAFAVSSQTDSRVILDSNGAEALLGMGDMLFKPLGSSRLQRIQGALVTEDEIHLLVQHCRHQAEPSFREELLQPPVRVPAADGDDDFDPDHDELLVDAAELVLDTGSASVSMIQRRLRVGYTRAGRLIDMLERRGIVGPYEGSKSRQVVVDEDDRESVLEALRLQNDAE